MLYIVTKFGHHPHEIEWHNFNPVPVIDPCVIHEVQADGDELELLAALKEGTDLHWHEGSSCLYHDQSPLSGPKGKVKSWEPSMNY